MVHDSTLQMIISWLKWFAAFSSDTRRWSQLYSSLKTVSNHFAVVLSDKKEYLQYVLQNV